MGQTYRERVKKRAVHVHQRFGLGNIVIEPTGLLAFAIFPNFMEKVKTETEEERGNVKLPPILPVTARPVTCRLFTPFIRMSRGTRFRRKLLLET